MPALRAFLAALAAAVLTSIPRADAKMPALHVLSFNLRYNNPGDGPNAWPHRKELAASAIRENRVDFAGLQEALHSQLTDLATLLSDYAWVGVGRDDGKTKGEYSAILYNRKKFLPAESGTFWLSEHPETPGMLGWDAACPRVATWAVFEDLATKQRLLFVNTHLDHKGKRARKEGLLLIARHIATHKKDLPVILTGDFNFGENDPPIRALLADKSAGLHLAKAGRSAQEIGGTASFNGFGAADANEDPIDHIFITPGIEVTDYRYLHKKAGDVFISDHWPVLAGLVLPAAIQPAPADASPPAVTAGRRSLPGRP